MMEMLNGYKTYVGLIITAAPLVAHLFGYQLTESFAGQFAGLADAIFSLIGTAIATYGRAKTEVPGWLARR